MENLTIASARLILQEKLPFEELLARRIKEHKVMPGNKTYFTVIELYAVFNGKKWSYDVTKATGKQGGFGKGRTSHKTLPKAVAKYNEPA